MLVGRAAARKARKVAPVPVAITWSSRAYATSYVLQVGTSTSVANRYNADVGNVLTATIGLQSGSTYYARAVPYRGSTAQTPTAFQTVAVP